MIQHSHTFSESRPRFSTCKDSGILFRRPWCRLLQALMVTVTCSPLHSVAQDLTLARANKEAPTATAGPYDVDGSGIVGPADVLALIDRINQGDSSIAYDLDSSGAVDEKDVDALIEFIGSRGQVSTVLAHKRSGTAKTAALLTDPQVVVTLTPPGPPPYAPASQIPVAVYVRRAQPGQPIFIRLLQFDSQDTDPALTLELPVTHTDSTAPYAPYRFFDFTSTALCAADLTKCGDGYVDWFQGVIFAIVWFEGSANASRQLTLPGDASPIYVGSVLVTLPANPGMYRLDLMNADEPPPNSGAMLVYGFGMTPDDPRVDLSPYGGTIAGGRLDLLVGSDNNCASGLPCAGDGNDCTQDICEAGVCQHPPLAQGAPCGNRTPQGTCDRGDVCDGAGGCTANYAPSGTICRPAVGECDVTEYCSGGSADCPTNHFEPPGTACSDDGDPCTDDLCDGAGVCGHPSNYRCGACCVAGGDCTNNLPPEQCPEAPMHFHLGKDCSMIACGPIPTVSEWGLVVLTLVLLTGAKIAFASRPRATDGL